MEGYQLNKDYKVSSVFITEINEQTQGKPFTGLNFPKHISKRPNLMV